MSDIIIVILCLIGSVFIFLAALGIFRMPDFYTRLSVTIKAGTFGIGFILLAVAINFNEFSVTTRVMAILFFLIITAPVSGHLIGKTAYLLGIKLWGNSVIDDLKDHVESNNTPNKSLNKSPMSVDKKDLQEKKDN